MKQGSLFDTSPKFADSRLDEREKPRLNRQCIEIIRLMTRQDAPLSSAELNRVAFRYSARIYDLKKAGIEIVIVLRNYETGVNLYAFASEQDRERAKRACH